jgi:hypothetical protein
MPVRHSINNVGMLGPGFYRNFTSANTADPGDPLGALRGFTQSPVFDKN